VIKALIKHGANIHAGDSMGPDTSLRAAARFGHLPLVKFFAENGADIHIGDDWAVSTANNNGHTDVVGYLVSKGSYPR